MDHELRLQLVGEAYARPTVPVSAPALVIHEALFHEDNGQSSRAFAERVADALGVGPLSPNADQFLATTPDATWKWERHGEFYTWTVVLKGAFDPVAAVPKPALLEGAPGARFVAAAVFVNTAEPSESELNRFFGAETAQNERIGSLLSGGRGGVWTNFRVGEDGWTRLYFMQRDMTEFRAGRAMRRLLEIEVYRIAALFALPLAKQAQREIDALEKRVGAAIADTQKSEADTLDELVDAAREVERIAQSTAFRFGAANAYRSIVDQRLREFREERIEGLQRISAFLERRFAPAMNTCTSTQARLDTLAARVERTASLLRTRVDIEMAAQNQQQLTSMNENAKAQLRLQRAVEGFSVAAIAYYAYSLAAAITSPINSWAGLLKSDVHKMLLALITVAVVWLTLRHLRKKL
ncbi:MAG: DUF3422 domain-containing protein [Hyphomonadaceae bacterium]|nr:DUF3422 domain-containing protein [Hyphomonadaceae bacterium]